ncbi:hypothetical protein O1611_g39 [Lasiodiplodia mahajangana]|uniref:Uncharacterized protein n=1 Tax=Lasiodiplodia mahajangana TaxID=1108764 RepID=A0ACC2K1X4_9PEZI|nr:hypothetical protein O1611_g39 [Lasiodiplodia mahajangana]
MAHRSSKHRSRYDDPYTAEDPYMHSPRSIHNPPAYEYIGTDEPLSPRFGSPPRHTFSPGYERARRHARTISPQRHSRHNRASTPPPPPHPSRHSSSPRPKHRARDVTNDVKPKSKGKHFYQDFAENNPKLQSFGKRGLTWLKEAAAAYAAAEAGKEVGWEKGRGRVRVLFAGLGSWVGGIGRFVVVGRRGKVGTKAKGERVKARRREEELDSPNANPNVPSTKFTNILNTPAMLLNTNSIMLKMAANMPAIVSPIDSKKCVIPDAIPIFTARVSRCFGSWFSGRGW